jgi:S-adenosylmethionine/arginine decarboxylase-like enzyme
MANGALDHRHIIVTAYVTHPPMTVEVGEDWLRRLVKLVDMEILMDANAIYCEDLGNEGVTGVVGLTTSHASFHSWHDVERPFINFDLYSCKDFAIDDVLAHLNEFGAEQCNYVLIDRNEGKNAVVTHGIYFNSSQTAE